MARQCPYLTERSGSFWTEHAVCGVCGKDVSDISDDQYQSCCNNWASGYEECPFYKMAHGDD